MAFFGNIVAPVITAFVICRRDKRPEVRHLSQGRKLRSGDLAAICVLDGPIWSHTHARTAFVSDVSERCLWALQRIKHLFFSLILFETRLWSISNSNMQPFGPEVVEGGWSLVNGPLIKRLELSPFYYFPQTFSTFSSHFGKANSPSHTLFALFTFFLSKANSSISFIASSTLGRITLISFLLAPPSLPCQVAVGGQICWQPDRQTQLGDYGSAHSFPPDCIPSRAGATDLLKPWHPVTQTFVWYEMFGPRGKEQGHSQTKYCEPPEANLKMNCIR